MPAAGVVMIVAVVLIVAAVVVYLVSTILALRKITASLDDAIKGVTGIIEKTAPVGDVVGTINQNLDAGVDLLEGLLVKKAGLQDAVGLVDGLYPGAAAEGFRNFPESRELHAPRISEVYTKGTLTLARLGREAPIAVKSPHGPALRDPAYGSRSARALYPGGRPPRPEPMPRSPVIGTDSPVQYPGPPESASQGGNGAATSRETGNGPSSTRETGTRPEPTPDAGGQDERSGGADAPAV